MDNNSNKKRWRGISICVAIILLVATLHTIRMLWVKREMEQYLDKKYGEEFVVQRLGYSYPYLGGALIICGTAFPKADRSLKFDIGTSARIYELDRTYGESYRGELWSKQKRLRLTKKLKNDLVCVDAYSICETKELYGKKINIDDAERLLKNKLGMYIKCGLFVNLNDYNRRITEFSNLIDGNLTQEQSENFYGLIQKLKNNNYKEMDLCIRYFNESYKEQVKMNPEKYLMGSVSRFQSLSDFKSGTVLCEFRMENINQIDKPKDIGNFINRDIPSLRYLYKDELERTISK